MTLQETKDQLQSLRDHCFDMDRGGDEIWEYDVKALEKAIELVDREIERQSVTDEEIQEVVAWFERQLKNTLLKNASYRRQS